jgi:hypothetical protein
LLEEQISSSEELQVITGNALNSAISGPLARYGPGGNVLSTTISYVIKHPLSPIGMAMPISTDVVDSGPFEYLLRGSLPLLVLMYFGLYRFLSHNLFSRNHFLTLFVAILLLESAITSLTYYRTACLLPFFVIWLNQIASKPTLPMTQALIE